LVLPDGQTHNAHMYQLLLPTPAKRTNFIEGMKANGIIAPFHYVPLHSAPAGREFGRVSGDMSITDDVSSRLVRLPMYAGVAKEQKGIIEVVKRQLSTLV